MPSLHNNTLRGHATALTASLLLAGGLVGCASQPQRLYQWEGYQLQVYDYFQGKPQDKQIAALETGLQTISAAGKTPPPGYHAQLGLLYLQAGKLDLMAQQFEAEKALFPESAAYIDFLLKNAQKQNGKQP